MCVQAPCRGHPQRASPGLACLPPSPGLRPLHPARTLGRRKACGRPPRYRLGSYPLYFPTISSLADQSCRELDFATSALLLGHVHLQHECFWPTPNHELLTLLNSKSDMHISVGKVVAGFDELDLSAAWFGCWDHWHVESSNAASLFNTLLTTSALENISARCWAGPDSWT